MLQVAALTAEVQKLQNSFTQYQDELQKQLTEAHADQNVVADLKVKLYVLIYRFIF